MYRSPATSTAPVFFGMVVTDRGDVALLLDASGAPFAAYRYDAWGNPQGTGNVATGIWSQSTTLITSQVASAIAQRQPLRYASYCFDSESGMYYLSSRHYDPKTRQFLSKDLSRNDGEQSAYQYCLGNPVANVDPTGYATVTSGPFSWQHRMTAWMTGRNPVLKALYEKMVRNSRGTRAPSLAWSQLWYRGLNARVGANCYGFAVLNGYQTTTRPAAGQVIPKPFPVDPGVHSNKPSSVENLSASPEDTTPDEYGAKVVSFAQDDLSHLGRGRMVPTLGSAKPPEGYAKVALAVGVRSGLYDYHWYVQNSEGGWMGKSGSGAVKAFEGEPLTGDRGPYTSFVGYFVVQRPDGAPVSLRNWELSGDGLDY